MLQVMRTRLGRPLAIVSTLGLLLITLSTAAPALAQSSDCTLTVKPTNGGPGTQFVFSGSGYQPTSIVLKRDGGPTKTVEVTPGDGDTFTIRLVAGPGDTGRWKAIAIEPGVCRASVGFSVGLPPTSTAAPADDGMRDAALAGFAGLGALFLLSGVVVLPRVTRSARSR